MPTQSAFPCSSLHSLRPARIDFSKSEQTQASKATKMAEMMMQEQQPQMEGQEGYEEEEMVRSRCVAFGIGQYLNFICVRARVGGPVRFDVLVWVRLGSEGDGG